MTVSTADIQYRLSGGAANSSPSASLGGVKSTATASVDVFDSVSSTEAGAGRVEYRCVYVHNNNATDSLNNAYAWINSNTPSTTTDINIGLGSSATNATEQTVSNETTAPIGVTFSAAASKGAGLNLGSIPAGQGRAVWIRRTVNAGTVPVGSDPFTIRVEGETV